MKADLHLHSMYSDKPAEWFLEKLGSAESYTKPETIYKLAKGHGMDFVTITDHNDIRGCLELVDRHPEDCFTGVELTAMFPEDGCKCHVLVYGFTKEQFEDMDKIRHNVYQLRDYLKENRLTHSLAHATFSVNGKTTIEHLEKLILLFDTFETQNGSINKRNNEVWKSALLSLDAGVIEELERKHGIKPFSDTAWLKGFTGGSDDHAGLFIAHTYTESGEAKTPNEFLKDISENKTETGGRHNDYRSFAFSVYKIVYDFAKSSGPKSNSSFLSQISDYIFEDKAISLKNTLKLKLRKLNPRRKRHNERIYDLIEDMMDELKGKEELSLEKKLELVYDKISDIVDEFFSTVLESTGKSVKKGDFVNLVRNISAIIPPIFISVPFFSTLKHMFGERSLLDAIEERFLSGSGKREKRVLWFSDTFTDLNGVAVTLNKIAWQSYMKEKKLLMASCLLKDEDRSKLPPNFVELPSVYNFKLPYYEKLTIKVPSILRSLKLLYEFDPDEVYISSPATIGVLGLLVAKLLSAKAVGVYHTDFTLQAKKIIGEDTVASIPAMVEQASKIFYSLCDELSVPTKEYMEILDKRGFDITKMTLFKRGIEPFSCVPMEEARKKLSKYGIKGGTTLLFAGRISKDKNIDFLLESFDKIKQEQANVNLLFVGDGPYLNELKKKTKKDPRVFFTDRVDNSEMPSFYCASDVFVFPSTTDTFGMVVLEGQACGLPAVVSAMGGPKEIIQDKETGYVVDTENENSVQDFADKTLKYVRMVEDNFEGYKTFRKEIREKTLSRYSWDAVLENVFSSKEGVKVRYFDEGSHPEEGFEEKDEAAGESFTMPNVISE